MKQLNESFQSQEIKNIIQNNEFFKYYIPEPFFTPPTLSNLTVFGEKHSNMLYYIIHYTIVKLYHTYLKLFNDETQDKFINTNTTTYFTKVLQLFNPRQYNKKQNSDLTTSDKAKIYRDINIYVKQLYSLLQQVVNHSNYESTAVDFLFRRYQYSNFGDLWEFNGDTPTINSMPTNLTKYEHNDMSELLQNYENIDFDVVFFYNNNNLTSIFNTTGVLLTDINYLTDQYKKIYDILISSIKNIKIDVLSTLDNYNILYLTNLETLFNKDIDIKNMIFNGKGAYEKNIAYQLSYTNNISYDYALVSLNPKEYLINPLSRNPHYVGPGKHKINDYGRRNEIRVKYNSRDYNKGSEFISNINYNNMSLLRSPISLSTNIKFCKQCDIDYKDRTTGEIVHKLLNILDTAYSHYSGILSKYFILYNKNRIKGKEHYDFNTAQKYVKYIGMYRNALEPLVQKVVDIMYKIKHNIPIDKKVLENSDIKTERRNIENLTMELNKYRARLLKFRNRVYYNTKINEKFNK